MNYIQKKKFSEIWTNEEVNLMSLTKKIEETCNFKRWEDAVDNKGYSGLTMQTYNNWQADGRPAKYKIIVHWTLDGINAFNVDLSASDKEKAGTAISTEAERLKDIK